MGFLFLVHLNYITVAGSAPAGDMGFSAMAANLQLCGHTADLFIRR